MLQQTDKSCYLDVVAGEAKSVDDPSAYPGAVGEVVVQLVLPKGEGLLVVAASTLAEARMDHLTWQLPAD
jgi:hypothetical protein